MIVCCLQFYFEILQNVEEIMADDLATRFQNVLDQIEHEDPNFSEGEYENYLEQEDEQIVEISEEEMLKLLDRQEDPFITCSRLFVDVDYDNIQLELLTKDNVKYLRSHGYVIIDDVISQELQRSIMKQTMDMVSSNVLKPAGTLKSNDPFRDNKARTDLITWLHHNQEEGSLGILMNDCFSRLGSDISKLMKLKRHWREAEYQLAFYYGQCQVPGFYEKHRDAFPDSGINDIGDQRRITAICYVNHAWNEQDGGSLRIWRGKEDEGQPLDIQPIGGRLVIFFSGAVDHQVLPTYKDRVAVTAWYS